MKYTENIKISCFLFKAARGYKDSLWVAFPVRKKQDLKANKNNKLAKSCSLLGFAFNEIRLFAL